MENLEKSIINELPQIPYILDQVGNAIKWAKEALDEGEFNKALEVAWETTMYVKKISDPNFFKTHLVIASILSYIPDASKDERFASFDTASKAVEKALNAITVDPKLTEEKGCFKAILLTLVPLAKTNEECFTVSLIGLKHDLLEIKKGLGEANVKDPITSTDYVVILGYALVMANIRMSNLKLLNNTYEKLNEIEIMLNNDFNY